MQKVYSRIHSIAGNVLSLRAEGVKYGELAVISSPRGESLAEVIRIDRDMVYLQVFAGCIGVPATAEVRFRGRSMDVAFSDNLLGRVFNGGGQPLDGGPALAEERIEIDTQPVNPARRLIPSRMRVKKLLLRGASSEEEKSARFCKRLLNLWPTLWTFAEMDGVEPTNNHAERCIRPAVLWRKGSFGTQSDEGNHFAERMMTAVQTLRLQGRSVLDFVETAIRARQVGALAPSLLPTNQNGVQQIRVPLPVCAA